MPKNLFDDIDFNEDESKYSALDKENRLKAKAKELDELVVSLQNEVRKFVKWAEQVIDLYESFKTDNKACKKYFTKQAELDKLYAQALDTIKEYEDKIQKEIDKLDKDLEECIKHFKPDNLWVSNFEYIEHKIEEYEERHQKKLKHYAQFIEYIAITKNVKAAIEADKELDRLYKATADTKNPQLLIKEYRDQKARCTDAVIKYMAKPNLLKELDRYIVRYENREILTQYNEVIKETLKVTDSQLIPAPIVSKFLTLDKKISTLPFDIYEVVKNFKSDWGKVSELVNTKIKLDEEARKLALAKEEKRKQDAIEAHANMLLSLDKDIKDIFNMDRNSYWLNAFNELQAKVNELEMKDIKTFKNLTLLDKMKLEVEPVKKAAKLDEEISALYYEEWKDEKWMNKVKSLRSRANGDAGKYMLNISILEQCEELFDFAAHRETILGFKNLIEQCKGQATFNASQMMKYDNLKIALPQVEKFIDKYVPNFREEWKDLTERIEVAIAMEKEHNERIKRQEEARKRQEEKKKARKKRREIAKVVFSYIFQVLIVAALGVGTYFLYQYLPDYAPYGLVAGIIALFYIISRNFLFLWKTSKIVGSFAYTAFISGLVFSGMAFYRYLEPIHYAYAFTGGALVFSVYMLFPLNDGFSKYQSRRSLSDAMMGPSGFFGVGISLMGAGFVFINSVLALDFNNYIVSGIFVIALVLDIIFNYKGPYINLLTGFIYIAFATYLALYPGYITLGYYLYGLISVSLLIKLLVQCLAKKYCGDSSKIICIISTIALLLSIGLNVLFVYQEVKLLTMIIVDASIVLMAAYFASTLVILSEFREYKAFLPIFVLNIVMVGLSLSTIFIPMLIESISWIRYLGLAVGLVVGSLSIFCYQTSGRSENTTMHIWFVALGYAVGLYCMVHELLFAYPVFYYMCLAVILLGGYFFITYIFDFYEYRWIYAYLIFTLIGAGGIALHFFYPAPMFAFLIMTFGFGIDACIGTWYYYDSRAGYVIFFVMSIIEILAFAALFLTFGVMSVQG